MINETFKQKQIDIRESGEQGHPISDDQIIRLFLATCTHSTNTIRNYYRAIERFRSFLAYQPLGKVSWKEVEAFKIGLMHGIEGCALKPLAPASVASFIAPLKSLYKWASDANIGFFRQNPTTSVKIPAVPITSKKHFLTKTEVGNLLKQLLNKSLRNYLIGLTLVMLGLRVSELIGIEWRDFDKDVSEASVWLSIRGAKGGKYREVKVPQQLWEMYLDYYKLESKLEGAASDWRLFPLTSRQIERIIRQASEESGLEKKVTPHWLRHTNATMALLSGASLQQVQETLGHSHINTTQRYLHTVEQLKKAAPDFVEEFLSDYIGNPMKE
ncbi:tyrosine-type recombinase/integrase [Cohnella sp.]|uniref:tyrosine-type recombinase/integrase n=1 Tax=Cohnella sp. TaxID=1883426 RepID=UPI003567045F